MTGSARTIARGLLVLDDRVETGRIAIEDGRIVGVELLGTPGNSSPLGESGADDTIFLVPGFVDIHVHGWGGHDAMGGLDDLDGMARGLLRHGVTSFLPTTVSAPIEDLVAFAERVRDWIPAAPADGAQPLGFNLEGPFIADSRRGAHNPTALRTPAEVPRSSLEPLLDGLRVVTIAPEVPGALDLISWLAGRGVVVSIGHSAATFEEARAGYAAGGRSTTHLFNAMTGVDHRAPGLAVVALLDDAVWVELIADGIHVARPLWELIRRVKPADRLLLVSDALFLAGMPGGRGQIGGLAVENVGDRLVLAGTSTLAGSVIALDTAVRNLVGSGASLPEAVAAAGRNQLAMLGITDRGRIAVGQRADLVELDRNLTVRRVMRSGLWYDAAA